MNKQIKVKIVADSRNWNGDRVTTFLLEYPRFIHSELMTHRLFSRNAASSRAIPAKKLHDQIIDAPFIPKTIPKFHHGMQASEYMGEEEAAYIQRRWQAFAYQAVDNAKWLTSKNVSKQLTNRLLEPFQNYKVLVTATHYDNFFKLRISDNAEDRIHDLARKMFDALLESSPNILKEGDWHLPFDEDDGLPLEVRKKRAVARCARISYNRIEGKDPEADIKLFEKLYTNKHSSPFEHICTPIPQEEYLLYWRGDRREAGWVNNFKGFKQLRYILENE